MNVLQGLYCGAQRPTTQAGQVSQKGVTTAAGWPSVFGLAASLLQVVMMQVLLVGVVMCCEPTLCTSATAAAVTSRALAGFIFCAQPWVAATDTPAVTSTHILLTAAAAYASLPSDRCLAVG